MLSPKDFKSKIVLPTVTLLDVRTSDEYKAGHLDEATNIDINQAEFEDQCTKLDKAKPVLVYCLVGKRSHRAAEILRTKGYKVFELEGGMKAWEEVGLPVISSKP
jgi:rhodanese-related sulfurtransferase